MTVVIISLVKNHNYF